VGLFVLPINWTEAKSKKIPLTNRALAAAASSIDMYYADHNTFPVPNNGRIPQSLLMPVDYMHQAYNKHCGLSFAQHNRGKLPADPFDQNNSNSSTRPLRYYRFEQDFVVVSNGPDLQPDITSIGMSKHNGLELYLMKSAYDVTNGTNSSGDIYVRSSLSSSSMTVDTDME
jgi:hypothetical protein